MRYIKQKHVGGCGIASVAMLSGVSYNKALQTVFPNRKPYTDVATHIHHMLCGLETLGSRCYLSYKKGKLRTFKQDAIIVIRITDQLPNKPLFHAIVWDSKAKKIMDPWGRETNLVIDEKYVRKYEKYRIVLL